MHSDTSLEIDELALRLISQEVQATLGVQSSSGAVASQFLEEARDARTRLLPLLRAAGDQRDIDLILLIEGSFLSEELEHLTALPRKLASLNLAISQLNATVNLLRAMRETTTCQHADQFFTLDKNRIYSQPKDEAQQFFQSHAKRLDDLGTGRWEGAEADLIKARIRNVRVAREVYTELQEQFLAPDEVREAPALYAA